MSEIKIGDYVRTRGIVGKLIRIEFDKIDVSLKWYVLDINESQEVFVNKPYIEKYSKNIIDLIEVGDVIECSINSLYSKTIKVREYIDPRTNTKYLGADGFNIKNCKVHKIYTKEQLEEIGYKVKEE